MSLDMHAAFRNKALFFTGVTGFVGKVFLYKVLKEFPDMRAIFVLVRAKKGQSPHDRLKKEVFDSACFDPLRAAIGDAEWARRVALVVPVVGDITEDRLGLNDADFARVTAETNYIVHLAATVDFQEKLHLSVQMNVLGTMRCVAIAHKCAQLDAFVHTSTCYVNWNRPGRGNPIKEQLYPLPFDPEAMCKHILSLHPRFMEAETARLLALYNYPNTYTFTKTMGEHLLRKYKGRLPLVIVRPAIIGCAYREPSPGWIDALTAAGGLFLTAGLGLVRELHCPPQNIADIVPVDHVVNILLKAAYKTALFYKGPPAAAGVAAVAAPSAGPAVPLAAAALAAAAAATTKADGVATATSAAAAHHHAPEAGVTAAMSQARSVGEATAVAAAAGATAAAAAAAESDGGLLPFVFAACTSSSLNHLTWDHCRKAVVAYWNQKRHPRALGPSSIDLIESKALYQAAFFLRRELPLRLMSAAAQLPPPVGSAERRKLIAKYEKALARAADLNFQFSPFTSHEWVFDQANLAYLDAGLSPRARAAFDSDTYDINWWTYVELYCWGMMKHIMKAADGRSAPVLPPSGSQLFVRASL